MLTLPWKQLQWGPAIHLFLPAFCVPPTSHTLPPSTESQAPSEHFSSPQSPESPGQKRGDWAPALSLTSYVTPGRSLHLAQAQFPSS